MLLGIVLLISFTTLAQPQNLTKNGVAIEGYDAVSYFIGKVPQKGSKTFVTTYQGAMYYFSTATNLEIFKKAPQKYAPAYGGWCAYAMGLDGSKVDINPTTYKIKNGKLLLFYNKLLNNTLDSWNKDEGNLYPKAEKNWTNQK